MSSSVVTRGFSRYYVLSLLKEKAMTGKQIMDETAKRTDGAWKPSPGLVYPLLGKLLSEGLIEETEGGHKITADGEKVLEDFSQAKGEFEKRLAPIIRFGLFGKLVAQDLVDRLEGLFKMLNEDISKFSAEQRERYKAFLRNELKRLEQSGNYVEEH